MHTIGSNMQTARSPLTGSRGTLSHVQPRVLRPMGAPPHKHYAHTIRCSSVVRTSKPRLTYAGAPGAEDGMSASKAAWQTMDNLHAPSISKPDTYFAEKNLEFVHGGQDIDLEELNDLFERVGFPKRDIDKMAVALANTHRILWVRATTSSRLARAGQLVGFARATGDGALSATIWDVAVNPAWQRIGLGRALMERLTAALVDDGITTITLYAEPGVVGLYERLGFVRDAEGLRGMGFQRKAAVARLAAMA